jgi:hypothetical protein
VAGWDEDYRAKVLLGRYKVLMLLPCGDGKVSRVKGAGFDDEEAWVNEFTDSSTERGYIKFAACRESFIEGLGITFP